MRAEGQRLYLRRLGVADVPRVLEIFADWPHSDQDLGPYSTFDRRVVKWIRDNDDEPAPPMDENTLARVVWAVCLKSDDTMIGIDHAVLRGKNRSRDPGETLNVVYSVHQAIHPDYRGGGYYSELGRIGRKISFEVFQCDEIRALVAGDGPDIGAQFSRPHFLVDNDYLTDAGARRRELRIARAGYEADPTDDVPAGFVYIP